VRTVPRKVKAGRATYYLKERILKPFIDTRGYISVGLTVDNKTKFKRVHRMLAEAFISNPNNYPVINHKNGDKTDYRLDNLEWCTQKYNSIHAVKTGLKKVTEKQLMATRKNVLIAHEKNKKKVNQLDLNGSYIRTWNSMKEIQKEMHIHYQSISNCCLGKNKTAYGFKWEYA